MQVLINGALRWADSILIGWRRPRYGRARHSTILKLFALCAILCGCSSLRPPEISQSGAVSPFQPGPEFEIIGGFAHGNAAVTDAVGRIHVIAMLTRPAGLHHLVIGPQGVESRELISTTVAGFSSVMAAFDHAGRLHVVNGTHHFVLDAGWWQGPKEGSACADLVLVAEDLVCAFEIQGEKVGTAGRWDWFGIPSMFTPPIPFPWYVRSRKGVIARETPSGASTWTVIERDERLDIEWMVLSADNHGMTHVLYSQSRDRFGLMHVKVGYARIAAPNIPIYPANSEALLPAHSVASISGQVVNVRPTGGEGDGVALAADPETGDALGLVRGLNGDGNAAWFYFLARDGRPGPPQPFLARGSSAWSGNYIYSNPRLAPAGGGRYHAIITSSNFSSLYYTTFFDETWSTPVKLGSDAYPGRNSIATDHQGNALAIWMGPDKKLVGRWILLAPPDTQFSQ
ncbi:hypothetical protein [Cupriavidus pinatubonensis]|uniref:hypothetical protein n=1 Tax=Cupriavidus pinatubonensis TaxID=248026 RepID=UPI003605D8D7